MQKKENYKKEDPQHAEWRSAQDFCQEKVKLVAFNRRTLATAGVPEKNLQVSDDIIRLRHSANGSFVGRASADRHLMHNRLV